MKVWGTTKSINKNTEFKGEFHFSILQRLFINGCICKNHLYSSTVLTNDPSFILYSDLYSDSSSHRCGWFCAYRWVWRRSGLWQLLCFRLCSLRALELQLFCSGGVQLSLPSFLQHQALSLLLGDFNRGVFLIYWRLACVKRWWSHANAWADVLTGCAVKCAK